MTKKIDKLTPEQEAKLPAYAEKWIKIGLSTEPVDLPKATAAVCKAYELAGLPKPTQFHVADSPISAIELIQKLDPSQSKMQIYRDMSFGCHDAGWLSCYEFFRDEVGIEEVRKLDGIIDLAYHCGWVSMYEDVVVFQHRPEVIKMDDQKRLHCEDGPAIKYRDGFSIYFWHGVKIPADWIEKKHSALTPKIALGWENIEQRRCACEILGWANILRELKSKVIDADEDPMIGTLLEVNIPEIGKEKFLQVLCGTGRTFAIPVPPNMKTALAANAWTFGLDDPETLLNLEVRT